MAGRVEPFDDRQFDFRQETLHATSLRSSAKVCAAIMGVESEHQRSSDEILAGKFQRIISATSKPTA